MEISGEITVAELATRKRGGGTPLAEACARAGIATDATIGRQRAATLDAGDTHDWQAATLTELVAHIQRCYHVPLRSELPRLSELLTRVVQKHADRLPDTLRPLQAAFESTQMQLLQHMAKEDEVLFPAITALEAACSADGAGARTWNWIDQSIPAMLAEHDSAGAALARMRSLTADYAPPSDAGPTFISLYRGLARLEKEMHVHVYLENHILFPRAAELAHQRRA